MLKTLAKLLSIRKKRKSSKKMPRKLARPRMNLTSPPLRTTESDKSKTKERAEVANGNKTQTSAGEETETTEVEEAATTKADLLVHKRPSQRRIKPNKTTTNQTSFVN